MSQRISALFLALLAAACGGVDQPPPEIETSRPNFVVILADDLGYGDLGVTGAPDIKTPNLDVLAKEGVLFTHAYANAPVCSPTRAALLSGQYPQRTGVDRVIYADERDLGLSPEIELLPNFLEEAGYRTGIVGKWHLGYVKESFPTRFGFDTFVGFVAGNIDYFAHTDRLGNPDLWRGEENIDDDRYFTELVADEAIGFIDRHAEAPFFLYLPFSAPHDPFQAPGDRASAGDQHVTRETNRTREKYRAMVESLDQQIGRVIAHLKKKTLADRTAVFFMSDNGGLPVVARNAPFRGFKGTLWEGGIRTPLIAAFPSRFPPAHQTDAVAVGMDLFPTVLELAGLPAPEERTTDGISLLPVLEGKAGGHDREAVFFRYQHPSNGEPQRAAVHDGWKYLRDEQGEEHLFHLANDPGESTDLREREQARFADLKEAYERWEEDVLRGAERLPARAPE